MKTDFSKYIYEKYSSRNKQLIEVTLKNGQKIVGIIISFIYGDSHRNEPFIKTWHLVSLKHKASSGIDAFGFLIGTYIKQKDILSLKFLDDNSEYASE